jgi:AAA domain
VLLVVWLSSDRMDWATYGAFAVAVVAIVPDVFAWARRNSPGSATSDEELSRVLKGLAVAVRTQWEKAAGERGLTGAVPIAVTWADPSLAVAGPARAAASDERLAPLPGLPPAGTAQIKSGHVSDLHALYGGLGSGRLIITGPPGSGKSSAAVLLLLAALRYRDQASDEDRPKIPVPVLVTAQDWDPDPEPVANWLARQVRATYPQLSGLADQAAIRALMDAGRIAVIIDGLDEIDPGLRPVALRALSQQANSRIVILSRTAEMASAAARQGILQGAAAIELRPVSPAEAVSYLERVQLSRPPEEWRDLTLHLRDNPEGPLSRALDNPLGLSLVRDTCQSAGGARELLAFAATQDDVPAGQAAEAITGYLIDRVLPAAYTKQPGQKSLPYDLDAARNALTKIAAQLNRRSTRDLYWWDIPTWAPSIQRKIVAGLAFGLTAALAAGSTAALAFGLTAALAVGGAVGVFTGWLIVWSGNENRKPPLRTTRLQLLKALKWRNLVAGLAGGLVGGRVIGLEFGVTLGLACGLVGGLIDATTADPDTGSSQSPHTSWRFNWNYTLVMALVLGLAGGLVYGLAGVLGHANGDGLIAGLALGLACGLALGLAMSGTWPAFLASVQVAIKWRTPVRLMRFLDDAHGRSILRTVGPAYQFRHARLQDRLAAQAAFPNSRPPTVPAQSSACPRQCRVPRISALLHQAHR